MVSDIAVPMTLDVTLAAALRASRTDIVRRWLDRIVARVTMTPNRVFPSESLLNHVPLLVDGIADYLESGTGIDAREAMEGKARELGELRHSQGFDAYEILKEHEILAGILFTRMREVLAELPTEIATADSVAVCWQRVAEATERIRQTTMMHFLRLSSEQVRSREERLRRFNRMVTHELKNRIGAIRGASALLAEPWLQADQTDRFHRMIAQNGEALQRVLENLTSLSRLEGDSRQQRNVLLPQAAAEAVRQLRDAAMLSDVIVELDDSLPSVEVDAAAVELALANYVSNAIKYSDRSKPARWVRVAGSLTVATADHPGELAVHVTDNGLGVPEGARGQLFEQFFRAHTGTVTGVEGTGLGLSIVKETIESLGGRVWAEFSPEASTFSFALPSRRDDDAAAAGTRRPDSVA